MFKIAMVVITACLTVINASAQKKLKLVWSDEFNYTGLPDTAKWSYETGFIRNQEKQYYSAARKENIYVQGGFLEIKAAKEEYPNALFKKGSEEWRTSDSLAHYTSASINTLGKESWTYGRIEIRAKIPKGLGVWPAIWMMGINRSEVHWPGCGEIDIMEFVGHDANHIFGSIHFAGEGLQGHGASHDKIEVTQPYNSFHIYALEWNSDEINIFMDDRKYHSFKVDSANTVSHGNPFRKPFYLLLNLALGGAWGGPIDDHNLPQSFLIDYVRVYQ